MELDGKGLVELIGRINSQQYSTRDLREFIHICTSFAASYIKNNISRGHLYFLIRDSKGQDIEDIALDAVAPLFARDREGNFYLLQRYFDPLSSALVGDHKLSHIFLKRLVISKVKQELTEKFKLEDPAGWRILRNIKLSPQRNGALGVFRKGYQTYYYFKTGVNDGHIPDSLSPHLPEIKRENLEEMLFSALKQHKSTPAVLESILTVLTKTEDYRNFICQDKLYQGLKDVFIITKSSAFDQIPAVSNLVNNEELGRLHVSVCSHINSIVDRIYVNKGKLSQMDSMKYISILQVYFEDLIYRNKVERVTNYMDHNPEYDFIRQDWKKHQNRLEYLVKQGKKHIQDIIIPY